MFTNIGKTIKKLYWDTVGEDLAEMSSGLSRGAIACIACGAIVGTAVGANALANGANDTSVKASNKVGAPVGGKTEKPADTKSVYTPCPFWPERAHRVLGLSHLLGRPSGVRAAW